MGKRYRVSQKYMYPLLFPCMEEVYKDEHFSSTFVLDIIRLLLTFIRTKKGHLCYNKQWQARCVSSPGFFSYRIAICDSKSSWLRFILKRWSKSAIMVFVPPNQVNMLNHRCTWKLHLNLEGVAPQLRKWGAVLHLRKNLKISGLCISSESTSTN